MIVVSLQNAVADGRFFLEAGIFRFESRVVPLSALLRARSNRG